MLIAANRTFRRSVTGRQPLYEDGGRGKWANPFFSCWIVGWLHPAAGDERVQVERPQPRSGEDADLDARGTGGTMGTPMNRNADRCAGGWPGWVCGSRAHLSIAASKEDQVGWEGLRSGGASHWGALGGARGYAAPAGAKGLLVVSMCQIASASRRARST
jgi:hypothetical protein